MALAGKSSSVNKASENGNGLILYQYYSSYYCQKVFIYETKKKTVISLCLPYVTCLYKVERKLQVDLLFL